MGAHEFHGPAPSRHGRKLSKLGPGIIDARRLDELLAHDCQHPDTCDTCHMCQRQQPCPVHGPWHDEGGEA